MRAMMSRAKARFPLCPTGAGGVRSPSARHAPWVQLPSLFVGAPQREQGFTVFLFAPLLPAVACAR